MKKYLAVFPAALLLPGICVVPAGAEEPERFARSIIAKFG